jgi:SAM-dependent methyltransferase
VLEQAYIGEELEAFAEARRWKGYWRGQVAQYLRGRVLEVGAGLGSNTSLLCEPRHERWVCLEPDPGMARELARALAAGELPPRCEVRRGTLQDLGPGELFDALLYADVLEHIADDRAEVARAAEHLTPGGALIVLSPAHQTLFSPFDAAIGHYRRYNRSSLLSLTPRGLSVARLRYLDSVGMLTSLANRLVLSQSLPTRRQLVFWDRYLMPISRRLDPLLGYRLGRSLLAVWVRSRC